MAALEQSSTLMEIARSLPQDEIPFKLRCAVCNKLAVNAFRLPCCDQAICETCQASLPNACPVCTHAPLDATLCKPNKALRTTLKAFLRTEEKKREKERDRPQQEAQQDATPEVSQALPVETAVSQEQGTTVIQETPSAPADTTESGEAGQNADSVSLEPAQQTEPDGLSQQDENIVESIETSQPPPDKQPQPLTNDQTADPSPENSTIPEPIPQETQSFAQAQQPFMNGMGYPMNNQTPFQGMGWQGQADYSQMMPFGMPPGGMMPFQNQMGPNGMSAIGMDPMASQGIFSGFGMNMNGMNPGMNMGMNFSEGQGMYGMWDAQSNMWNGGPDKFNANAFANRMGADIGPDTGYRGYNMAQPHANYLHHQQQQHQHQHPHQQQHQHFNHDFQAPPSYGGRGYGRGRGYGPGGRGRGGYMSGNYPSANFEHQQHQMSVPDYTSAQTGGVPSTQIDAETAAKQFEDELRPGGEEDMKESQEKDEKEDKEEPVDKPATKDESEADNNPSAGLSAIPSLADVDLQPHNVAGNYPLPPGQEVPVPIRSVADSHHAREPFGPGAPFQAHPHPHPGVGHLPNGPHPSGPRGQGVAGAPAAPRAMRQGLPNTGMIHTRPHLFNRPGTAAGPRSKGTRSPSAERQGAKSKADGEEARGRSRSRSRSRSHSRRRSRHQRSRSPASSYSDEDREDRHSRRRRSRRDVEEKESSRKEAKDDRSRSPSVHRSRRDRDRDRERDLKRGDGKSSRRSHRHRSPTSRRPGEAESAVELSSKNDTPTETNYESKSRHGGRSSEKEKDDRRRDRRRDRHRDRDRDRDREKGRGRDYDRDRERKRSRRDRSESPEDSEQSHRRSRRVKGDNNEIDGQPVKREKRPETNGSLASRITTKDGEPVGTTSAPIKDPHTLEREARNRERLLKEQQRREAMKAGSGRRRDSKPEHALGGRRRVSYKYEDEVSDQARIEEEREAARWV